MPRTKKNVPIEEESAVKIPFVPFVPKKLDHPRLKEWIPSKDDGYVRFINDVVVADFKLVIGGSGSELLDTFSIVKKHYKERMPDVTLHINYFIRYYDTNKQYFVSLASAKYLVDKIPDMTQSQFKKIIIERIVTPEFVANMKRMADDLYSVNINTDMEGKYKSTPKITNEVAKNILAISFAFRALLPLCLHYANTNVTIVMNKEYIPCFDKIFMAVVEKFEENDIPIFVPICRFVKYRLDRAYQADRMIWDKKKQLYGTTYESEFQNLIHEVILVKSLYKISYDRSVVSYIDGVFTNSYNHFRLENFKSKPVEIEADTGGGDSDDYLTHAEAIEMSMYRIDESTSFVNDVNNKLVFDDLIERFGYLIKDDEFKFYNENVHLNNVTQIIMHSFYSGYFHNSQAIYTITREETIMLLIILKKFMQAHEMTILPQIITATVQGKFKENIIKNAKFTEMFESTDVYKNVIEPKYRYVRELNTKEDPIYKCPSMIINSTFILVDPDPKINGTVVTDIPNAKLCYEYQTFLSITK